VRKRLYALAFAVLMVGLSAGGVIYLMADDAGDEAMAEIYGSKTYARQLQRFGGKASVVFDDIDRWLAARWRGKSLGVTIVWLSVLASGCVYFVARRSRND
jgi:hypothetical protein